MDSSIDKQNSTESSVDPRKTGGNTDFAEAFSNLAKTGLPIWVFDDKCRAI
jgi:hypothetical protein